ncbi:putative cobalt transporter CbtA [Kribbella sp. VKM Ac-2568]|nr:putative cobalt transporter CbtA [Kribbella sp. VKM Ac-2568]
MGGAAAGGAAAVFSLLVVEPTIRIALAVEEGRATAEHSHSGPTPEHTHDAELVGRGLQQVGGALAVIAAALLLSLVYAVVLARVRRTWDLGELRSALLVAVACFAVLALGPGLKYPANPPAVGDPDTVTQRTTLYVTSIVVSALIAAAVVTVVRTGHRRSWSSTRISWAAAGILAVGCVLLFAGLPAAPDAIPSDVGAALVWRFRVQSLGLLALLWATLGLVAGSVLSRAGRRPPVTTTVA